VVEAAGSVAEVQAEICRIVDAFLERRKLKSKG
jgi:hypothetical protein